MWSEDPGRTPPRTEEPKEEREADSRGATTPLRWFFGFDGWGLDRLSRQDDEFVLA